VPDADNFDRLIQAMRVIARPGAWEATVRLKPEHLGDLTIAVRVERNTVTAIVNAEAAAVRQWLESQEQALRSGMAEHGLQLDRFLVQRDPREQGGQPQDRETGRRRKPQQEMPRFEVVV
jgi:flagellar hook-length control protein FliK